MHKYDIESYGISITTLEEVFLKINEEFRDKNEDKVFEIEEEEKVTAFGESRESGKSLNNQSIVDSEAGDDQIAQ